MDNMGKSKRLTIQDMTAPRKNQTKVNITEALELRFRKHWSLKDLAEKYGVSTQRVSQQLTRFINMLKDPEVIEGYDAHKEQLLSSAEFRLLENVVNDKKLKQANLGNIAYAFKQISDANRLERGKSTSNVALSLEQRISILDKRGERIDKNSK